MPSPAATVARVSFEGSLCQTLTGTGDLVATFDTVFVPAFNSQYSTPLSPDGERLYVGTWRRGLFCYDTRSGEILWRQGPGKVRQVDVVGADVIIEMADRGVYRRNARTGELLGQVKMGSIDAFFRIDSRRVFVGPKRGQYFVLSIPDLCATHVIPAEVLNPDRCLSFTLLEAYSAGASIIVSGWEQYPNMQYTEGPQEKFTRGVFLDEFVVRDGPMRL